MYINITCVEDDGNQREETGMPSHSQCSQRCAKPANPHLASVVRYDLRYERATDSGTKSEQRGEKNSPI